MAGVQSVTRDDKSLIRFDFVEPSYLLAVGIVLFGAFLTLGSDLGLEGSILLIGVVWALHVSLGLTILRASVIGLSRWRLTARWADPGLLVIGHDAKTDQGLVNGKRDRCEQR